YNSLAIGPDGYPIIATYNATANPEQLEVIKCNTASCSSFASSSIKINTFGGYHNSLAIGPDGYPIIATWNDGANPQQLEVIKCLNPSCAPGTDSTANPPTTARDLDLYLDKQGYTNATSSNNVYDYISGATSSLVYNFVHTNTNNTDQITPSWEGQVSESQTVSLQIYRMGSTNAWETVVSSSSPTVNLDTVLGTTTITTNLSDYYDSSYRVYTRVVMATTTQMSYLRTDSASTTFAPFTNLTQRAYVFYNDDGPNVASSTIQAATSTARTGVLRGERMIVAYQVDNTLTSTTTLLAKLQFDKNDNSWQDVGSTTEIRYSFASTTPGAWSLFNSTSTPMVDSSCNPGGKNVGLLATAGTATATIPLSIGPNNCGEFAFAIHTGSSTANQTYRFRLFNAQNNSSFTYSNATATLTTADEDIAQEKIRFSKGAFGSFASSSIKIN
ncbi:MAG: hypothetical protein AABX74_03570, partial [Nanoarchaeota archaeon]